MQRILETVGASMLKRTVGVAVAASFLVLSPTSFAGPKGTDRPMKGECDATFVEETPPTPPLFIQTLSIYLECHLTHLGSTTGTATQFVDFGARNGNPPFTPPFIITNTIEYIAANGDKLYARFAGAGVPDGPGNVAFSGMTTYVGGTGRFSAATGLSADTGGASLITNEGFFSVNGRISY